MKKSCISIILVIAIIISTVCIVNSAHAETMVFQSLGTITSCTVDANRDAVIISGSVKHSVLIGNRDAQIAVYRFGPWIDVASAVSSADPEAVTDMSITFDFELPCQTLVQETSLYAVSLIKPDGTVTLIAPPVYPDASTGNTSGGGFKAVLTENHAAAVASLPGSAIVDVYLDKLNNGNNSGYIYNANGDLFYFDKSVINELDRIIRTYTAAGSTVYLRYLISPGITTLPFCFDTMTWALNKCVVVDNDEALKAIYAYTAFLVSRYNGDSYGSIDGIILGRGADMPILNNYAILVSEDYATVYARSLALIGLAATGAANGRKISLIVPIGDSLTSAGRVNGEEFIYSVAEYLATHSKMTFTVLCESRHNPYGITDEAFIEETEPETTQENSDYTTEDGYFTDETADVTIPPETTSGVETIADVITTEITENVTSETSASLDESEVLTEPATSETLAAAVEEANTVTSPEVTETQEDPVLQPNTNADGFYCTDNIEVFVRMFEKLKKTYSSVNKGFAWCWYPGADTAESSLGVCYSYNYMKLASLGADFYAIGFENELAERFPSISHLFKYIDTKDNVKETAYARSVFSVSDWSEIIKGYKPDTGVFTTLLENELQPNIEDFSGSVLYLDYSSGKGAADWYQGIYCSSLSLQNSADGGCLQAVMDLESAGFEQAEIGYTLKAPEPLLVGDALTFDIQCGEDDGSLYELSIYIDHGSGTLISKAVVLGGIKCNMSANVSKLDKASLVNSIRISLKRITGEGPCTFNLYSVTVNDYFNSDDELEQKLKDLRDYLMADVDDFDNINKAALGIGFAVLTGVGCALLLLSYVNDRRKKNT